jgi:putative flippase GtrA
LLGAGLGGAIGSVADIAVLITLHESGAPVAAAAFAGAAAGAGICFAVNKRWAFRDRTPVSFRQVGTFAAVAVVTATLMAFAMHAAVEWMGVPYLLAKALCAAAVFAAWSYPAQRRLVFAPRVARDALHDLVGDSAPRRRSGRMARLAASAVAAASPVPPATGRGRAPRGEPGTGRRAA